MIKKTKKLTYCSTEDVLLNSDIKLSWFNPLQFFTIKTAGSIKFSYIDPRNYTLIVQGRSQLYLIIALLIMYFTRAK